MNHLPLYSKKKNSQPMKTEPGSSQKKYVLIKQLSNSKHPTGLRDTSPLSSEFVKVVPNNIIYDKQTLYMEVQELKKIINNLVNENTKLKTRLAIIQTQKERLNKSKQKQQNEQRHLYRPYFISTPSQIKTQTIKNEALKKQVKQLNLELQIYKKENVRIKRSMKYSKINELQIQLKMIIQENKHIFNMYQQMKVKVRPEGVTNQNQVLEKQFNRLCKENKMYFTQIENLNVEIMNLQSQLRIERAQKASKEKSFRNDISEEKRLAGIKLKQIIDFRRQNSSINDSKIRSIRAQEKLQQTSFKTHHVHVQPIRKNHIFNNLTLQKLDSKRGSSVQIQQKMNSDLLNENQRLRLQLNMTQQKLRQVQQKSKLQIIKHIESKPSAVPTFFSQNADKEETIKSKQKLQQNSQEKHLNKKDQHNVQVKQKSERKTANLEAGQDKNQQKFVTPLKVPPSLRKSLSQRSLHNQSQTQIDQTPKIKTQYMKQTINLDILPIKSQNKKLLREIKQLLGYRFSYQKYRFVDLKNDIESSNAKELSFIDVCHMLVNEPFYLNLEHCRVLAAFIFQQERPKHQEKVETTKLLIKLRKIIKDFEQLAAEKQLEILQSCIQLIKKNMKTLVIQFQQNKNVDNTIPVTKLREILEKCEFRSQEILYIITEVSINATDLDHLPYELILQRFSVSSSARSSRREIIFQNGEQENSNINSSQNSVLKRPFENVDGFQSAKNTINDNNNQPLQKEQNLDHKNVKDENGHLLEPQVSKEYKPPQN